MNQFFKLGNFAALIVCILLAGCASMLSDEEVTNAYDRCAGRGDGSTLQAAYCSMAIDSGKLTREELENAYAVRCRINQHRGRQIEAQRDCDSARQIAGLPASPPSAPLNREPEPPPRNYQLVFNGLYCPRVMKDSIFNPDNEIFANVAIIDEDGRPTIQKLLPIQITNGKRFASRLFTIFRALRIQSMVGNPIAQSRLNRKFLWYGAVRNSRVRRPVILRPRCRQNPK